MLKQITPRHLPICGAGFAIAGLGCAFAFAQAFDLIAAGLAPAITVALGLSVLFYAYRCERAARNRAALEEPVERLTALHESISDQAREVATQTLDVVQQRDWLKRLVRELTDKQNWLDAALEQLPAGVLLVDEKLNVVKYNTRIRQLFGIPASEVPESLRDLRDWPAETLDGAPIPFENWPLVRAMRGGQAIHDQEMRLGIHRGGWFDAAVSAASLRGPRGELRGGVLLMNELSARQQNAERLALLESAVVHANDAIIVLEAVSAQGKGRSVKYVNDAFTRLTGYEREEVLGRSLHFLRGEDTDDETLVNLRVALDHATPFRTELLNYRKDGSVVWVDLSLVPVQGPDGRCTHYIMIQRDVTARKVAEGSLRESEELFRGIFEATTAGVSITDEHGRFISCNPAFASLVGRNVEEVLALTPEEISHPDDWAAQQPLIESIRTGQSDRYQFPKRYLKPNGTAVWTELTFAAIHDSDGNYQYGLGVSVDVTARRHLEEQLRQSQKMEALGQLAGGIAHDFNNLLTAVLGNLALLKIPEGDPNRDLLRIVEQAAARAADLTRKLLGYARRNQLLVAATQPGTLIDEVVDILRRTLDPRIEIVVHNNTNASVTVDSTLINQALFNLCLNARDAMPGGGTLTLEADEAHLTAENLPSTDAQPGDYVRLTVIDTGHGIADDIRDRLFEPFFTTKSVGKGTGLGLPMVHGIMRQHEGFVTVDSTPGHGARFSLYLPAAVESAAKRPAINTRLDPESREGPSPLTMTPAPSATILLVDDEDMIRSLGRAVLRSSGYIVLEAVDGCEAVDLFEREHDRISLVVLDVTMPRLSGRDAFRQMKLIDPDVRVLFSSGYSSEDVAEIDGSAGLLSKPYRPNDLLVAVRRALRRTRETVGV
jgi:PAS domain S-box-containing protein